eukprot:CAMPEP_0174732078 /NCGR_PEP_ID=MMETSP1094-20130205/58741_1 /TAXON_ID=156173 /ORGANISM="Chrysochromulina brevifilum, Strain UTEX LB 985" /LENGTH=147 /DNA_ID=CAMNT_0015934543 /DNA_START=14 /DNA_END=454 /DNA_ORIENTATION=+
MMPMEKEKRNSLLGDLADGTSKVFGAAVQGVSVGANVTGNFVTGLVPGAQKYARLDKETKAAESTKVVEIDLSNGEDDEDGPKVSPLVTAKLLCCYIIVLLIGVTWGAMAIQEHWLDLTPYDPGLSVLNTWLTAPAQDAAGEDLYCD